MISETPLSLLGPSSLLLYFRFALRFFFLSELSVYSGITSHLENVWIP